MRIYILGCSGSGKTYVAERLKKLLGLSYHNLDDIFWEQKYIKKASEESIIKSLKQCLRQKDWIIEGVYYDSVLKIIAEAADIIFYFNRPSKFCVTVRIIKRFIKRKLKAGTFNCTETIKTTFELINWNLKETENDKYEELLKAGKDKVHYYQNNKGKNYQDIVKQILCNEKGN